MSRGGSKPGERRGGRCKGTPSRKTQAVIDRLEALGCDPIESMARIAMDETADFTIRAQMYKELAQYVAPKRKAIEVRGKPEFHRRIPRGELSARHPILRRLNYCLRYSVAGEDW
jgi:hypothetical protein